MAERLPLLLIPGLASNEIMWQPQIKGLSDVADCHVASMPAYDDLGAITEEILSKAPNRFAVAGHSLGGYICFEILRRAPERVLLLGLFSMTAEPESREASRRRLAAIEVAKRRGFPTMAYNTIPRFLHPERREGGAVFDSMLKQALEVGEDAFCQHTYAAMKHRDYRDLLAGISCPTMILVGRQDVVTRPTEVARLAHEIPGSVLKVIEHSAHMITLENPDSTNRAMRHWLAGAERAMAA